MLIIFADKMRGAGPFALQKLFNFLTEKMAVFLHIICLKI